MACGPGRPFAGACSEKAVGLRRFGLPGQASRFFSRKLPRDCRVEGVELPLLQGPLFGQKRFGAPGLGGVAGDGPPVFQRLTRRLRQLQGFLLPAETGRDAQV